MPLRASALAAASAVVLLLATPPVLADHQAHLGCSALAPVHTACTDGPVPAGGFPTAILATEGFVGSIDLILEQAGGSLRITCASHGSLRLVECGPWTGSLVPGAPVTLRCLAGPLPGAPAATGPLGFFGCQVQFP